MYPLERLISIGRSQCYSARNPNLENARFVPKGLFEYLASVALSISLLGELAEDALFSRDSVLKAPVRSKTPEGLEKCRPANWKQGNRSTEVIAARLRSVPSCVS